VYPAPFRSTKKPGFRERLIRFDRGPKRASVFTGLARLVLLMLIGCAAGGLGVATQGYLFFTSDLPSIKKLKEYSPSITTQFFADDGELIAEFSDQRRYVVQIEEVPANLINAFVSAEDKAFWEHDGVNYWAIIRAAIQNLKRSGSPTRGGGASTITQQVAKNFLLTGEQKFSRKIKEAFLAVRIEKSFSNLPKKERKKRILHLYVNQIYLGSSAYGVEAASRAYFGKPCRDLTLAECALIAGLAKAPSTKSPKNNLDEALGRRGYVLGRMLEDGRITQEQHAEASKEEPELAETVKLAKRHTADFVENVRRYVEKKYGNDALKKEGLKIYTTVDQELSRTAQAAVDAGLRELDKRQGFRGPVKTLNVQGVKDFLEQKAQDMKGPPRFGQVVEGVITHIDDSFVYVRMGRFKSGGATKDYVGRIKIEPDPKWWVRKPHLRPDLRTRNFADGDLPFQVGDLIFVRIQDPNVPRREAYLKKFGKQDPHLKQYKDLREDELQYFPLDPEQSPVAQSALMLRENRSGFVRALIGGSGTSKGGNYKGDFNRATQARRQVGSSFKPVIYAAALNRGFTCADLIVDSPLALTVPGTGEVWRPKNYRGGFAGPVTFRECLVKSRNIPTIKILQQIGIEHAKAYARKLGYTSPLVENLTMALGSMGASLEEQVNSYSIFPNKGYLVPNTYVKKIVDRNGKVLEEHLPPVLLDDPLHQDRPKLQQASYARKQSTSDTGRPDQQEIGAPLLRRRIDDSTAYLMSSMLQDVIKDGTATILKKIVGRKDIAGKTGTTNENVDAWFMGFSPDYTCGVWVGFDDELSLGDDETGGKAAAPIWGYFMRELLKDKPEKPFPIPQTVEQRWVDPKTGMVAASRNGVQEYFKVGSSPTQLEPKLIQGARWDYSGADLDQF
jgi:penicillin-binding protein 1A